MRREIFKVQLPIDGDDIGALVYNRDRSVQVFKPSAEVRDRMEGEPKRFFYGTPTARGTDVVLHATAPWRDW